MSVHYKFKSTLDFDTITFDGLHISVGDLKRAVLQQKRLGKVSDFDLQITNAQTKQEYDDNSCLIPKNTSLIIARIPLIHQPKKPWDPQSDKQLQPRSISKADGNNLDLSKMKGSEEDKIQAMMLQSTADYDPKSYQRIRGQTQSGEVPATYRCNKCKNGGHWIKNCPFNPGKEYLDKKRTTGIPKSFRDKNENENAQDAETTEQTPVVENKQNIPEDLLCSICNDLFMDAVMIPCCGSSFCDDCVRTALLESEDNECPDCKEKGSSPGSLIPNRFLRNSVNSFKNETGYKSGTFKKVLQQDASKTVRNTHDTDDDGSDNVSVNIVEIQNKEIEASPDNTKTKETTQEITNTINVIEETPKDSECINTADTKAESPLHDDIESDYEDNIVVTMPPAKIERKHASFAERPFNGRHARHPKPPGIEGSPHNNLQMSPLDSHRDNRHNSPFTSQPLEWERDFDREHEYREQSMDAHAYEKTGSIKHHISSIQPTNQIPHYSSRDMQERPVRPMNPHEMFPSHRMAYQQMPPHPHIIQGPPTQLPMGSFDNMYLAGPRPSMGFNRYPHFVRPVFHNSRGGYMPMRGPPSDHQNLPTSNLASVYQGVAAKVGTGIIDDPLEAFNRIMKEKEKRKEERRRTPEHRRSRSNERQKRSRFRSSPYDNRGSRELATKKKRERSRERPRRVQRSREKGHERDKSFRHRRSNSFSDKSSRSRSWSNSPLKRSKSPNHNRRSRSRGHTFNEKHRQVEKPRFYHRGDEFRHMSPKQKLWRSNSREDRTYNKQHIICSSKPNTSVSNDFKGDDMRSAYERSPSRQLKQELHSEKSFKRYEDNMSESLEPPPPGYEAPPAVDGGDHWFNPKLDHNNAIRSTTPDLYEKYVSRDIEEHKIYENNLKDHGTRIKSSYSRSVTPPYKLSTLKLEKSSDVFLKKCRSGIESQKEKEREKIDKSDKKLSRTRKHDHEQDIEKYKGNDVNKGDEEKSHKTSEKCERKATDQRKYSIDKYADGAPKQLEMQIEKGSKQYSKQEKPEKRTKERKKKIKEKKERKKIKKDKRTKRDRDKPKTELRESDSEYIKESTPLQELTLTDKGDLIENTKFQPTADINVEIEKTSKEQVRHEGEQLHDISKVDQSKPSSQKHAQTEYLREDVHEKDQLSHGNKSPSLKLTNQMPIKAKSETTPPPEFKHLDSVLDILGYETDFDDLNAEDHKTKIHSAVPEPSRWERDEQSALALQYTVQKNDVDESGEKVTNEVLRKAENAIFARAINAIRPIEIKKGSERQKLNSMETSPPIMTPFHASSKDNMKSVQVTVPLRNSQERSVEIKDDTRKRSHSPSAVKAIKKRLGSKIVNKITTTHNKRSSRRSHSMDRNSALGDREKDRERVDRERVDRERMDRERVDREREIERIRDNRRDRETGSRCFEYNDHETKSRTIRRSPERGRRYDDTNSRGINNRYQNYHTSLHLNSEKRDKRSEGHANDDRSKGVRKGIDNSPERRESRLQTIRKGNDNSPERRENRPQTKSFAKTTRVSSNERKKSEHPAGSRSASKSRHDIRDGNPFNRENSNDIFKSKESRKDVKPPQKQAVDNSSDSSNTDYDSDTDDQKRKKKHKYKKDKKRVKRSSSAESMASAKKKHKKKNKSAKKKKKDKK